MRKRWRDVLIFAAIAGSIPLIILLLIRMTPHPPVADNGKCKDKTFTGRFKQS